LWRENFVQTGYNILIPASSPAPRCAG
jgi:hypothetical protein